MGSPGSPSRSKRQKLEEAAADPRQSRLAFSLPFAQEGLPLAPPLAIASGSHHQSEPRAGAAAASAQGASGAEQPAPSRATDASGGGNGGHEVQQPMRPPRPQPQQQQQQQQGGQQQLNLVSPPLPPYS